jgi:hypothetical protein
MYAMDSLCYTNTKRTKHTKHTTIKSARTYIAAIYRPGTVSTPGKTNEEYK